MQKISVTIPTGQSPRTAVARQTMQNAINRSIPALSQDEKPEHVLYKTAPAPPLHTVRAIASGTSSVTNEFTTRTRGGQSRLPARTSVVDVGNIFVHPTERMNVRGVQGFFPPLKIRGAGGSMRTRYSTSAPPGSGTISPRNSNQEANNSTPSTTHSKALNVQLAPSTTPHNASSSSNHSQKNKEEWPKCSNSKRTNESPVRFQHNEIFDPAVPKRDPVDDMQVTSETGHVTALSRNSMTGKNKDAPFVRAYKLKQRRQHKIKEIMDSNYRSPTMADLRDIQTAW